MIRFNNDYNRGAFDCILKALADTNTTSYPGYGEDEWCDKAEQIIKGLIGRDDFMIKFIPGATQVIRFLRFLTRMVKSVLRRLRRVPQSIMTMQSLSI